MTTSLMPCRNRTADQPCVGAASFFRTHHHPGFSCRWHPTTGCQSPYLSSSAQIVSSAASSFGTS
jgi:hypothetical protein